MKTSDAGANDRAQDLAAVAESALSQRQATEPITTAPRIRVEQRRKRGDAFRSRFLTALLRALSAWPS